MGIIFWPRAEKKKNAPQWLCFSNKETEKWWKHYGFHLVRVKRWLCFNNATNVVSWAHKSEVPGGGGESPEFISFTRAQLCTCVTNDKCCVISWNCRASATAYAFPHQLGLPPEAQLLESMWLCDLFSPWDATASLICQHSSVSLFSPGREVSFLGLRVDTNAENKK